MTFSGNSGFGGSGGSSSAYSLPFVAADFTSEKIIVTASTHNKGDSPSYDVYEKQVEDGVIKYFEIDPGLYISHNESGDVTVEVGSGYEFNGLLKIY